MDDVSPGLKAFLDYVAGKKPADPFVDELEEAVKNARKNREWRHEYMTLLTIPGKLGNRRKIWREQDGQPDNVTK